MNNPLIIKADPDWLIIDMVTGTVDSVVIKQWFSQETYWKCCFWYTHLEFHMSFLWKHVSNLYSLLLFNWIFIFRVIFIQTWGNCYWITHILVWMTRSDQHCIQLIFYSPFGSVKTLVCLGLISIFISLCQTSYDGGKFVAGTRKTNGNTCSPSLRKTASPLAESVPNTVEKSLNIVDVNVLLLVGFNSKSNLESLRYSWDRIAPWNRTRINWTLTGSARIIVTWPKF